MSPVASSSASDRKNEAPSMLSTVAASVQFAVTAVSFAFAVIHVPAPTLSEPADVVSPSPSSAVTVTLFTFIPDPNVANPFTARVEEAEIASCTYRLEAIVEDAVEMSPPDPNIESPSNADVEEA